MSYSSAMKFDIEKFDGRINFDMWKVQVNDVLIQSGLHKALKGNTSKMEADKWEELDLRAASAIHLCLANNVLANVQNMSSTKKLWERLEGLYQAKNISNRLLLKEQFHNLRMNEERRIKSDESTSSSSMLLTRSGANEKKIHAKNLPCWKCGRFGHLKRNCPGGAVSEKDSETSASNVSLILGDDGNLI
ncbi:hypothetical protein P8452_17440 [Trifolium repens]|nr:hypothetical protein P8452_17440 [Trifolium repens]